MNAVCAELPVPSNKGKKYKKNGPLTEEQRALIEKWYVYAMAVAYDNVPGLTMMTRYGPSPTTRASALPGITRTVEGVRLSNPFINTAYCLSWREPSING